MTEVRIELGVMLTVRVDEDNLEMAEEEAMNRVIDKMRVVGFSGRTIWDADDPDMEVTNFATTATECYHINCP